MINFVKKDIVTVVIDGRMEAFRMVGRLLEINKYGVVIEMPKEIKFYQWSKIITMYKVKKEEK